MFPEIVRDDIFRLETRRLWLRWPTLADADPIDSFCNHSHVPHAMVQPLQHGAAAKTVAAIANWRIEMQAGTALHLVIAPKAGERQPIGAIHLVPGRSGLIELDYRLHPDSRGQGLMTEAAQAVLDTAFMLGAVSQVGASPLVVDSAGRRVLERCGFTFVGTGMSICRFGIGLMACDHFCLDRKTWHSLKSWNLPDFGARLTTQGHPCVATIPG